MALNDFHAKNWQRMHESFAPPHDLKALVICVQEEIGELAGAVLGVTKEKARKAHLTNADVLDAVADAITYLSLVASSVGCEDLEKLIGDTFNMVSDRAGSSIKTVLGQSDDSQTDGRDDLITVCDYCLCASCWQGKFYCDNYITAGTVQKTRRELLALNREHPSYLKTDVQLMTESDS